MSYTIELREIVENNIEIFDFDYPLFDESYRKTLQEHFIEHFYFSEIGFETIARFKERLKIKFNTIMPYWNKFFYADSLEQRILNNYDVTEEYERTLKSNYSGNSASNGKSGYSDNPVTKTSLENVDYYTSIEKNDGTSSHSSNNDTVEKYRLHKEGNIGVQTDADAIEHYWRTIRKLELEIFNDCNDLFMQIL